jgi:xylan 1,4-beta-xylosidase
MIVRSALLLVLLLSPWVLAADAARTFCNPLNLGYGVRAKGTQPSRHGADPAVVLFNDRYWLFSTWDRPGYRVSDDLVNWSFVPFAAPSELVGHHYTAAAVVEIDGWLYFTENGPQRNPATLYRTQEPESGVWEKVSDLPPYLDPFLFVDPPTGRLFMYHGLERPIRVVELDRETFAEIPGTDTQLMPAIDPADRIRDGWEVCTWDNDESSPPMRGNKTFLPCREGAWVTYHDGRYYLQYASPGTTVPGYADGVLIGDSPLGPFTYNQHSPISRKASGFITSAGHSALFQDRHGNWWRAVTMLIGVHERFERRIGLFPAGFDEDGIPFTRTELGDLPIVLAHGEREHGGEVYAGWWLLSAADVTASSSLHAHPPVLAADEDIRTWWSAASGDAGEWLQLDLGQPQTVHAVQINFAEQDLQAVPERAEDVHRFVLSASVDGERWSVVVDRRGSDDCSPHTYVQLDEPIEVRFFRLENVHTPAGGKFAVSGLRIFGVAGGSPPAAVDVVAAQRDALDRRKVMVRWMSVDGAAAYLVRYGITPDKLNQHHLVRGRDVSEVTLFSLNNDPPYHFRVDAMNGSGMRRGATTVVAP